MSKANLDTWSDAEEISEPSSDSVCPVCEGAGFVHPRLESGKPDYGRVVPCQCARDELEKEQENRLLRYSNLGLLTRFTFDELIPQGRSGDPASQGQFNSAYNASVSYSKEPKGWLVLIGPSGCGKTHLAAAIANERIKQGQPVFFITVPDLLDHLRSTYAQDSEMNYDELFDRVCNTPLLILDDLGVQNSTPWAKEKLDQLLNYRFSKEIPTIITSIIPVEQLDDRLRTRLNDSRVSNIHVLEKKATSLLDYGWGPGFELQKTMTFRNYDWKRANLPAEQQQNIEMVYRAALDYAESPDGWLILLGVTGCGKTHLAAAIANYRYQAGQPALFIVVPDFLDHLRSTFSPDSKISYDQLFEKVKNAPLLILDDFGEQSTTPWAQEKLYQVINHRYNARLATIITSRCALDEVESRISSRLIDPKISLVLNITAPDYRGDNTGSNSRTTSRRGRKKNWSS